MCTLHDIGFATCHEVIIVMIFILKFYASATRLWKVFVIYSLSLFSKFQRVKAAGINIFPAEDAAKYVSICKKVTNVVLFQISSQQSSSLVQLIFDDSTDPLIYYQSQSFNELCESFVSNDSSETEQKLRKMTSSTNLR